MPFEPLPLPLPLKRQRLAIEAPLGPVLVIAGPGAGKTYCLIARIDHLIHRHSMPPERLCAVTFTNRAAEEIAARLQHTLGERAETITRGTIHALCLALLREHTEAAGLQKGFGVADEEYQKVILGRLHVPLEQRGPLLTRFSRHRIQKQDYPLTADDARVYREYTTWLAHRNMLDFDDLVTKAEELLRVRGDIADAIAARWDYLLVDEFQDVNAVQYDLLKRLAAPHGNFFAVGDDEQSIFAWTGADPYVLVRFQRDYAINRPIVLDKNCRCSRQIFETARRVLAHNPQLFEKQLSAEQDSPYEVAAFAFRDEEEEASWLLEDIAHDRAAADLGWGDYAVLYRKHRLGEYLEGRLLRAGIPCRLARGRARRHQVRDRRLTDRARSRRSGRARGVRSVRALGPFPSGSRGGDRGELRRLPRVDTHTRPAPARARSRYQEAVAPRVSGRESPRPQPVARHVAAARGRDLVPECRAVSQRARRAAR